MTRILLVEDEPDLADPLAYLLRREGYNVTTAENGEEVLRTLSTGTRPDLVIMDVEMPVLDGLETTRCIRRKEADRSLSRMPILALTAHAMEGDGESVLAAGMDRHLTKPLRKPVILGALAEFCPAGAVPVLAEAANAA